MVASLVSDRDSARSSQRPAKDRAMAPPTNPDAPVTKILPAIDSTMTENDRAIDTSQSGPLRVSISFGRERRLPRVLGHLHKDDGARQRQECGGEERSTREVHGSSGVREPAEQLRHERRPEYGPEAR